jgi:hypothetical protein
MLEGANTSAGQSTSLPEHVSAASHTPALARHVNVLGRNVSVGQLAPVPLHVSATSQSPAAARHSVPDAT